MKAPLLRAKDAADLVMRCADELRELAGLRDTDGRASAAAFVFSRMVTALTETIRDRGSARIAKTYEEWATLANARGSGKTTKAASLRSPFSQWKVEINNAEALSPSTRPPDVPPPSKDVDGVSCKFNIVTPDEKGKRGGVAGLSVQFFRGRSVIGIRPPAAIAEVLPIDRELARIAEEQKREEELASLRKNYLAKFTEWWGPDEARKAERALRKRETSARSRWMNRAAVWIVAVLVVTVTGTSLYAAYREQRERLFRVFSGYSIQMMAECDRDSGQPYNQLFFREPTAVPPFTLLRDGEPVATIETAQDGLVSYKDFAVQPGRSYVYSFGQKVWGVGRYITTPSVTIKTSSSCRPSSNIAPVVRGIRTSPATPRVGEPFELWADAFDPNGDALSFHWSIGNGRTKPPANATGQRVSTVISEPGRHSLSVHVSDGFLPLTYFGTAVGVSAMNPANRPPSVPFLMVAPRRIRPGQSVAFVAPAADPDGDTLQYEWNFDNDTWLGDRLSRVTDVVYAAPGTYHPSVEVIDTSLATTKVSATIEVTPDAPEVPLQCTITSSSLNPPPGTPVTFTITRTSGFTGATQTVWDFDDRSPLRRIRGVTATHTFKRGTYAVSAMIDGLAICKHYLLVGDAPPSEQSARPVRGSITPARGTTMTRFTFVARPPAGSPIDYEYRWELRNRALKAGAEDSMIDTVEWQASNIYSRQLPQEGLWEVAYIARKRDGSGQEVHVVDDVFVRNNPPPTAPQTAPPSGKH